MQRLRPLSWIAAFFLLLVTLVCPGALTAAENDSAAVVAAIESLRSSVEKNMSVLNSKLDKLMYPKWEYKIVNPNRLDSPSGQSRDDVDFAGLGREGFELVGINTYVGYVFKRRL